VTKRVFFKRLRYIIPDRCSLFLLSKNSVLFEDQRRSEEDDDDDDNDDDKTRWKECGDVGSPAEMHANPNFIIQTKCWARMRQSLNWTCPILSFKLHSVIASAYLSRPLSLASIYSPSVYMHSEHITFTLRQIQYPPPPPPSYILKKSNTTLQNVTNKVHRTFEEYLIPIECFVFT
jgi:hypothetical protein